MFHFSWKIFMFHFPHGSNFVKFTLAFSAHWKTLCFIFHLYHFCYIYSKSSISLKNFMFHFPSCFTFAKFTLTFHPLKPPRFSTLLKSSSAACDSDEYIFVIVSSLARPRKNYSRRVIIPLDEENKVHVFPVHDKSCSCFARNSRNSIACELSARGEKFTSTFWPISGGLHRTLSEFESIFR